MLGFKKYFLVLLFIFANTTFAYDLLISEIMYNPEGNDSEREWIEIFNNSQKIFTIFGGKRGWRINDGTNHLFEDINLSLNPGEILLIVQNKNKFLSEYPDYKGKIIEAPNMSLKNEEGMIIIYDENKNLVTQVSYSKRCGGYNNNRTIIFYQGNCYESKNLKGNPGIYPDELIVSQESKNETTNINLVLTERQQITEKQQTERATPTILTSSEMVLEEKKDSSDNKINQIDEFDYSFLVINEFFPNPKGSDENKEFIEIFNEGDKNLILDGLYLKIGRYKIKLSGEIKAKSFFVINNNEKNFYLRNSGESIELRDKNDNLIHKISYVGKAPEDLSFSRVEEEWIWTYPTPGKDNNKENVLDNLKEKESPNNKDLNEEKPTQKSVLENDLLEAKFKEEKDYTNLFYILGSLTFIFFLALFLFRFIKF